MNKTLFTIICAVLLIAILAILVGCVNDPQDTDPVDTPITPDESETVVTPPAEEVKETPVTKQAKRIHILGSQTLQNQYIATSGNTWGIVTLTNCRFTITDGMIKISGSLGTNYVTVETSVQNVLIVY